MSRRPLAAFLALALALPAASTLAAESRDFASENGPVRVTTVAEGLEHPWGLAFLPDGRMLVTERPGRLRIVNADGTLSRPIAGVPRVQARGQGGL
ncbi:PQQ-dependent sugar dehydrogenase, partial [Silanimonas sp.]|uniref:PQQ-dependent sugar dehydrogenase n=1 Tax=Silanimonas sp. TaxID=1929290 RepID=UPI0037C72CDC